MKNLTSTLVLALTLTMGIARAEGNLLVVREDAKVGCKPSLSAGIILPKFEFWTFSQTGFPIWEVGRTEYFQLNKRVGVLAGGYLSYWQVTREFYVEPWSQWNVTIGTTHLTAKVAAYAPLCKTGSWMLYSDQTAATWNIAKSRVQLGVATDWWLTSGSKPTGGIGPVLNVPVGKATLTLRALRGAGEPDSCRMQLTCPF